MRLTVIGCAGSFPGPESAASSYLVQADDETGRTWRILLDLGNGALGPLQRIIDPAELDAVLISHLHPDHFLDLCGLYVVLHYHPHPRIKREAGLPVLTPDGGRARVSAAYGPDAADHLDDVLDLHTWSDKEAVTIGPFTVTPRRVEHPVETFGFRVEDGERVLAYSADTDSCQALIDLAREADLLLAEASFQEDRDEVRGIHLTGRRAGEAAADAGARRLVLTHIPVWTDAGVVLEEARSVFGGPVEVARPGDVYDV